MTTHNQTAQHAAPRHRWAWRLGAAVGARRWPKRLAVGVAAWIALGVITAWLDPWATGLVSLLGGVGAWLSAGVGLMVTALLTHGSYRRHGVLAALAAVMLGLAATATLAFLVDGTAVTQVVGTALIGVVVMYGVLTGRIRPYGHARSDDGDGYMYGAEGWGWYCNGMKVHD